MKRLVGVALSLVVGCSKSDADPNTDDSTGDTGTPPLTTDVPATTTDVDVPATSTTGAPATSTADPTTTSSTTTSDDPSDSTTAGETGPVATDVPVFIAQGHYGRTTISCDDGHTWIHDTSQDDAVRCFENDLDCDHNEFAGRGIAWGDGQFVLAWGWGEPGTLSRSDDAYTFTTVMTDTPTFADVAFGNGRFVANNSPTRISDDGGLTWSEGGPLDIGINTRAIEFVPHGDGWFIVAGESGDQRAIVRSPDGVTWTPASERPPECGSYTRGIAYGADVVVLASGDGSVCRSPDGGDTWARIPLADRLTSPPVWTGAEFFVYDGGTLHRSPDGAMWTSAPVIGDGVTVGPLARSPEGTFVAANDGWMVWYDQQKLYRSPDGLTWETLIIGDAFTGSHPIYFMAHGRVQPGSGCEP